MLPAISVESCPRSRGICTLKVFGDKIAKRISSITPARAKELQGKKDALQKECKRLDLPENIELNTILKELYADSEYRTLVEKKERWVKDYLHKTSHALVQQALPNYKPRGPLIRGSFQRFRKTPMPTKSKVVPPRYHRPEASSRHRRKVEHPS